MSTDHGVVLRALKLLLDNQKDLIFCVAGLHNIGASKEDIEKIERLEREIEALEEAMRGGY